MMSEESARTVLATLEAALVSRCDCHGTGHELPCRVGGIAVKACCELLRHVLGESEDFGKVLAGLRAMQRDMPKKGKG